MAGDQPIIRIVFVESTWTPINSPIVIIQK